MLLNWLPLLGARKRFALIGCDCASTDGGFVGLKRFSGTLVGWSSSSRFEGEGDGVTLITAGSGLLIEVTLVDGAAVVMMGTKKERSLAAEVAEDRPPVDSADAGALAPAESAPLLTSASGSGGEGGGGCGGDLLSGRKVARSGCQTSGAVEFGAGASDEDDKLSSLASALKRPLSKLDDATWPLAGRKWAVFR